MNSRFKHAKLILALALLAASSAFALGGRASEGPDPLLQAMNTLKGGDHKFVALIGQTLIPRAIPGNIGARDERFDFRMDGENFASGDMRVRLMADAMQGKREPLVIERVDGASFAVRSDGSRRPVDDPLGATLGTHFAGFLAGARNVQAQPAPAGHAGVRVFSFDVDGRAVAQHVRDQAHGALAPALPGRPTTLERVTGSGELWLRADGKPLRQLLNLNLPAASEKHDAQLRMQIDFSGFGAPPHIAMPLCSACEPAVNTLAATLQAVWRAVLGARSAIFLSLAAWLAFLLVLLAFRQRPTLTRAMLAVLLAAGLCLPQPLMVLAGDLREASAAPKQALGEALGLRSPTKETQALVERAIADVRAQQRPAMPATSAGFGALACGNLDPNQDSDNDGMNDQVESCLGTSAFDADDDQDFITDTVEVQGIVVSGTTWTSDPKMPDSNNDGLLDGAEYAPAQGGTAPQSPGHDANDFDGDGVPNVWDEDNDGDGVPDGSDLSPFAVGSYTSQVNVTVARDGGAKSSGRHTYIEFQIQPQDLVHMRYANKYLDWPADDKGQILDFNDNSRDDLQILPVLKFTSTVAPDEALTARYGASVFGSNGVYVINLPLSPQSDTGAVRALYGKLAYQPGSSDIQWTGMQLQWMVRAINDASMPCPHDNTLLCQAPGTESTITQIYPEDFRLTGLNVSASGAFEGMLFGTPGSPNEDRWLFHLMIGAYRSLLAYDKLIDQPSGSTSLQELAQRYDSDNTPSDLKFGVPVTMSTVAAHFTSTHMDAGLAHMAERIQLMLDGDFNDGITSPAGSRCQSPNGEPFACASLGIMTQMNLGSADMRDGAGAGANNFSFDLNNISEIVKRGVRMVTYKRGDAAWQPLETAQVLGMVQQRYADRMQQIRLDYLSAGVDVSESAIQFGMLTLYLTYQQGTLGTLSIDQIRLTGDFAPSSVSIATEMGKIGGTSTTVAQVSNELAELASATYLDAKVTKPAPPVDPNNLTPAEQAAQNTYNTQRAQAQKNATVLKAFGGVKVTLFAANIALAIANAVCAGDPELAGCGEDGAAALEGVQYAMTVLNIAVQIGDAVLLAKSASATQSAIKAAGTGAKFAKVSAGVGFAIGLVFAWTTFGLTIASANGNPVVVRNAVALAIVTTVYLVLLLVLSFIPFGQIITAILGILDLILSFIPGDWSVSKVLTELFYSAKVMTEIADVTFSGSEIDIHRGSGSNTDGFIFGNRILLSNEMSATISVLNNGAATYGLDDDGKAEDLDDSDAVAGYIVRETDGLDYSTSMGTQVRTEGTAEDLPYVIVRQALNVTFVPTGPKVNASASVMISQTFTYVWADCGLYAVCEIYHVDSSNTPEDEDSYDDSTATMYWDVLPATLSGLWSWSALRNHDRDGDGLDDDAEHAARTLDNNPDSDGDGLDDGYEVYNFPILGTDPSNADSDGDGLHDRDEVRNGLSPREQDSDGDGLNDDREVFHLGSELGRGDAVAAWTGGWLVNLPGGIQARVFSHGMIPNPDAENLLDGQEFENGTSPYAVNDAPALRLRAAPWSHDPQSGRAGVYVSPGSAITATASLASFGQRPITSTLSGCIPPLFTGISGGALSGDRRPAAVSGPCAGGGSGFAYSFAASNTLQIAEQVSASYSMQVGGNSQSQQGSMAFSLPYLTSTLSARVDIGIDADDPAISFMAPVDGAALRGSTFIIGGLATDPTSWVTQVQPTVSPGAALPTLFATSTQMAPFAYAWALPADGVYTLNARAVDHVGRSTSAAPVQVTVDNTVPSATLSLPGNFIKPTGSRTTVVLNGNASDNLSGIARVQVSIDRAPWREVFVGSQPMPLAQAFSTTWTLGRNADGSHLVRVRALDRSGNISPEQVYTIIVDSQAPTSALTTNRYMTGIPDVPQVPLALSGLANDAGRAPLTLQPVPLNGSINPVLSATLWLQPERMSDDNGGIFPHWLGDINGDGRADLAIGLPAAKAGAGAVVILYGKSGGFTRADLDGVRNIELLADSTATLVGMPSAGIGSRVAAVGDVNCDTFNDVLIGDPVNHHAVLVFGAPDSPGPNTALSAQSGRRIEFNTGNPDGLGSRVAAAGDVNGDGADDFFIGTSTRAYLLTGHCEVWAGPQDVDSLAAAHIDTPAGATLMGVGDMNGDQFDDFAIGVSNGVRVFDGDASYARRGRAALQIATAQLFGSAVAAPTVAALGDVNGDGRSDFALSGTPAQLVFGAVSRPYASRSLVLAPTASGFVAAPGDVNADGLNDVLLGNASGDAVLIHGAAALSTPATPAIAATLSSVSGAASAPFAAGADLNCDDASDLLLVPANAGSIQTLQTRFANVPGLNIDALKPSLQTARPAVIAPQVSWVVDDDGGAGATHTSINAAISAASAGDVIYVRPGVYAPFGVSGKNSLHIIGAGADQVFIDGGGASKAVNIASATGVRVANMTIFNAAAGVSLGDAGINGSITPSLRTVLDHLVIHSFTNNAIEMDRESSVSSQNNTFASAAGVSTAWIETSGPQDAALYPTWTTLTPGFGGIGAGGGLHETGGTLYGVRGNGSTDAFDIVNGVASANAAVPETLGAGSTSAMSSDGHLYALAHARWKAFGSGLASNILRMAVNDAGQVLAQISDASLFFFDGSTWTEVVDEVNTSGGHNTPRIRALASNGNDFYIGGEFTSLENNNSVLVSGVQSIAKFTPPGTWSAPNYQTSIGAGSLHIAGGQIYIGPPAGDTGIRRVAIGGGSLTNLGQIYNQCHDSGCSDSDVRVNAMHLITPHLYIGGNFQQADIPNPGSWLWVTNTLRLNVNTLQPEAFGSGANGEVFAFSAIGSGLFMGGDFTNMAGVAANRIARYNGSAWAALGSGANARVRALSPINNTMFVGGDFTTINGSNADYIARYNDDSNVWSFTGDASAAINALVAKPTLARVAVGGAFTSISGTSASRAAYWHLPHMFDYTPGGDSWAAVTNGLPIEPQSTAIGATGTDVAGRALVAFHNNGLRLWRFDDSGSGVWSELTPTLSTAVSNPPIMTYYNGHVWMLLGSSFYVRPDVAGSAWSTRSAPPAAFNGSDGGGLVWDGGSYLYATQGGGGNRFARYHLINDSWEELPVMAATVNTGGGLARIGTQLFQTRGGNSTAMLRFNPVNVDVTKLFVNNNVFVAPAGSASASWITPTADLPDFGTQTNANQFVGAATWSPAASNVSYANARLVNQAANVFRLDAGSALGNNGYQAHKGDVYVSPAFCATCANDGLIWNDTAFDSIQSAINSGAIRVRVRPGIYVENIALASGGTVIGSGADLSVISGTVRAEGIKGAQIARFTIQGGGFIAEQGAQLRFARNIVRGAAVGVTVHGSSSKLEMINNTLVNNGIGMQAVLCADVDVRNGVFANNTQHGLQWESCAVNELERYNLFFGNGPGGFASIKINNATPSAAAGVGDVAQDPLFVNAAGNDFRLAPGSPAVGAGSPSDPVPPAVGGRIDMGYAEQAYAAVFVDDDYCAQCINDGLLWQVDAFSTIASGLGAAASELQALRYGTFSETLALRYLVGVGAGWFTETVSVPSHISLVGLGADKTHLYHATSTPVNFNSVINAELAGLDVRANAGAFADAVRITGNSNGITLTRNVLREALNGLLLSGNSSAIAEFNTLYQNTNGFHTQAAVAWLATRNNIVHRDTAGGGFALRNSNGQLHSDHNLIGLNTGVIQGNVATGPNDRSGLNPLFFNAALGNFRLQANSAAVDRASPEVPALVGGGGRADQGAFEQTAAPIVLLFGREGQTCAVGNSGVKQVEVNIVAVANAATPFSNTLPASWPTATLLSPLATASYWTTSRTPSGAGLHRIYSRASDRLDNIETVPVDLYEGAFYVDPVAPSVTLITPSTTLNSSAATLLLGGQVAAFDGERTAKTIWFESTLLGVVSTHAAEWESDTWTPGQPRRFRASVGLVNGTHTVVAKARDAAGNTGSSATTNINMLTGANHSANILTPDGSYFNNLSMPVRGVARFVNGGPATVTISAPGAMPVAIALGSVAANTPVPFAGTLSLPGFGSHTISAEPANALSAGTSATRTILVDGTAPAISLPASLLRTGLVIITGTASDASSGLDKVDVSFDGGYVWLPATLTGGNWAITQTLPDRLESTSFPVRARVHDRAGNTATANSSLILDSIAPRGLHPVRFNHAEGSYFDSVPTLIMTWTQAHDFNGVARVGALINQVTDTQPLNSLGAITSTSLALNSDGAWYAHVVAVDNAGNQNLRHYGPWFVSTGLLCAANQVININGELDLAHNEWRANEMLDDDELAPNGTQRMYATWDSNELFLGWRGALLPVDGTLWFYIAGAGDASAGSSSPVSASIGTLPFAAKRAIEVTGGSARVWRFDGSVWTIDAGLTAALLSGHASGGTEVRTAYPMAGGLSLLGMLVNDGQVTSVFPTTGRALLPASAASYSWALPCTVTDPSAGQPRTDSASVSLGSLRDVNAPLGANQALTYIVKITNLENRGISGSYGLLGSIGLSMPPIGAATPIVANATRTLTLTATTAASLTGLSTVTATLSTPHGGASLTHLVDGTLPTVSIEAAPGDLIGPGLQQLRGSASDVGSSVALVELSLNNGPFQPANGTTLWSLPVTLAGTSLNVRARATDASGQQSAITERTLSLDATAPAVSFVLPAVITPGLSSVTGSAIESPGSGIIADVEVQIDSEGALWQSAGTLSGTAGVYIWNFAWPLPYTDAAASRMRVRARDGVGNISVPSAWQSTTLDSIAPVVTITSALRRALGPLELSGSVSDKSGISAVEVILYAPDGRAASQPASLIGNAWSWRSSGILLEGDYVLHVRATDGSGNRGYAGPVNRFSTGATRTYLPMAMR